MKILLIGILGTYNYGCEAIIRGIDKQIHRAIPNCQIDYASLNIDDDSKRLYDCNVNIIPLRNISKYSFNNIRRKLCRIMGYEAEVCMYKDYSFVKKYDCVLSIGGDMYTLSENGGYSKHLSALGNYCKKNNIKYSIWGCSIGPFDKNIDALTYFKKHLGDVSSIVVRESFTLEYLKRIGISSNVYVLPDPAFYIRENQNCVFPENLYDKVLGLNLSPLSSLHYYSSLEEAIEVQVNVIDSLIDKYNCRVELIPHVFSPYLEDNDKSYLERIKNKSRNPQKLHIDICDEGYLGLTSKLKSCDIILSSRMHCCLNAITLGVPSIFLSYSSKSLGMSRFVYGDDCAVLNLKEFSLFKIEELISKCSSLKSVYTVDNTFQKVKEILNN